MITKKTINLAILTFFYFIVAYFIEFILLRANDSYFWCISLNYFELIQNVLPIHCDEGPYRHASESIDFFFSENNPYQKRPIYVFSISLIRNIISFLSFGLINEYIEFRISMIIIQYIILFLICQNTVKYFSIDKIDFRNLLLLFSIFSIPNIRWNLFFPSHGNITFLLLIYTLKKLKDSSKDYNSHQFFLIIGMASLLHRSAIIFGLIFIIIKTFEEKKIKLLEFFKNFVLALFPSVFYELFISFSKYTSFDWNREIYGQFYWLVDLITGNDKNYHDMACQKLETFLNCSLTVTKYFISYFLIGIIFFLILLLLNPSLLNNSNFINIAIILFLVYVFWSLQGLYPNFRFVNYSLGYFIFFSLIYINHNYYKSVILSLSILIYEFSIQYLEPYSVTSLETNFLTFISMLLFVLFLISNFNSKLFGKNEKII
mgnify:CR=1 FL=1